jgi:Flp pilus assembly protein TadG
VEFALVVPLLMAMFFGIVDYGLWFNNSLGLRQGVREAARQGVVSDFTKCTTSPLPSTDLGKLSCATVQEIGPVAGTSYAMVTVPSGTWKKGNTLLVCGLTKTAGLTGFTPLPNSGWVRSKTLISIEADASTPSGMSSVSDTLPAGVPASMAWSSWCT